MTNTEKERMDLFEKSSKYKKENARPIMTDLIRIASKKQSILVTQNPVIQIQTYQAINNKKRICLVEKNLLNEKQKNKA